MDANSIIIPTYVGSFVAQRADLNIHQGVYPYKYQLHLQAYTQLFNDLEVAINNLQLQARQQATSSAAPASAMVSLNPASNSSRGEWVPLARPKNSTNVSVF